MSKSLTALSMGFLLCKAMRVGKIAYARGIDFMFHKITSNLVRPCIMQCIKFFAGMHKAAGMLAIFI